MLQVIQCHEKTTETGGEVLVLSATAFSGPLLVLPFGIGPIELIIILVIVILIFGPSRLAGAGRALGESLREFKKATNEPLESKTEAKTEIKANSGVKAEANETGDTPGQDQEKVEA